VRRILPIVLLLGAASLPADASKTKLRLERIDSSQFADDGIVKLYATVVDLEGTIDENRPAPAFGLKLNGKSMGKPEKAQRFQLGGDPLDLILVIESSALYGPKNIIPPTPPPKGSAPAPHLPPVAKGGKKPKVGKLAAKKVERVAKAPGKSAPQFKVSGDEPLDRVKEAIAELLENASPKWRVLVIDYGGDVNAHPPFRAAGATSSVLDDIGPDDESGDLRLVQAIDAALITLNKPIKEGEPQPRRLIVVVSDGLNFQMDRKVFRGLGDRAAKQLVPIHAIAFSPTDDRGPLINLGEVSKRSNGTFRWARTPDDLHNQIETLADELNKQYVLTYKLDVHSLEGKTFQLTCGELTSNPLKFGAGFIAGATGTRGLGWWWALIVAGVLGLVGIVLVVVNRSQQATYPMQQRMGMGAQRPMGHAATPAGAAPVAAAPARPTHGILQVVSGALAGTRIPVGAGQGTVTVGKGPSVLQITDDASVSTRHAQVTGDASGVLLTDVGSTNGTFVNQQRITTPVYLNDGDLVRFGQTQIKFRTE
jgi:hypothetical protein